LAKYSYHRDFDSTIHFGSIAVLSALGQTMNIMTLGGLALAVGLLVDDATIENVHSYRKSERD
jgi:multidrug efflux pump subunit AcrB